MLCVCFKDHALQYLTFMLCALRFLCHPPCSVDRPISLLQAKYIQILIILVSTFLRNGHMGQCTQGIHESPLYWLLGLLPTCVQSRNLMYIGVIPSQRMSRKLDSASGVLRLINEINIHLIGLWELDIPSLMQHGLTKCIVGYIYHDRL